MVLRSGSDFCKLLGLKGAPVAQLDRAFDYESKGRKFESCRAHHKNQQLTANPQSNPKLRIPRGTRFGTRFFQVLSSSSLDHSQQLFRRGVRVEFRIALLGNGDGAVAED
jgi:hypothetical protein